MSLIAQATGGESDYDNEMPSVMSMMFGFGYAILQVVLPLREYYVVINKKSYPGAISQDSKDSEFISVASTESQAVSAPDPQQTALQSNSFIYTSTLSTTQQVVDVQFPDNAVKNAVPNQKTTPTNPVDNPTDQPNQFTATTAYPPEDEHTPDRI